MNLVQAWEAGLRGEAVSFRPHGSSMKGLVPSGALVRVEPCDPDRLEPGDIVLVRVKGNVYLHLVKAISAGRFLIGNNRGGTNGWTQASKIAGLCTEVDGEARPGLTGKLL